VGVLRFFKLGLAFMPPALFMVIGGRILTM